MGWGRANGECSDCASPSPSRMFESLYQLLCRHQLVLPTRYISFPQGSRPNHNKSQCIIVFGRRARDLRDARTQSRLAGSTASSHQQPAIHSTPSIYARTRHCIIVKNISHSASIHSRDGTESSIALQGARLRNQIRIQYAQHDRTVYIKYKPLQSR